MTTVLDSNSSTTSSKENETKLHSCKVVEFLKSVENMPEELFLTNPEFYKLREFKERMLPLFQKNIL